MSVRKPTMHERLAQLEQKTEEQAKIVTRKSKEIRFLRSIIKKLADGK